MFQESVIASYAEAGRLTDLNNIVWSNRMTYDAVFMGCSQSSVKHLKELRDELGLP